MRLAEIRNGLCEAFSFCSQKRMRRRLVIVGGPHVGKTTLSERLSVEYGITNNHHSDDVKHLGWSESSEFASKWFDEPGDWIIEGVQMARALRKWLAANPEQTLDADILILDNVFGDLLPGQESMRKGVHTVFAGIENEIIRRGARVHRLTSPEDAIELFRTRTANPEESGNSRRQKSTMLKSKYPKLDDIPEGDRPHYMKVNDEYVLQLDGEHPVQLQNKTLAKEKKDEVHAASTRAATAEAEVTRLKAAAESQPTLPSGHVAVPADEARLLDTVKELGEGTDTKAKVESVKTKLAAYPTLETKVATLEKSQQLQQVADSGIGGKKLNLKRLQLLDKDAGGLTYEERDITVNENGKTTTQKAWHVKDGTKWVTLSEYSDTHWKDLGIPLTEETVASGTRVLGQVADDKSPGANVYEQIRKDAEAKQKAQQIVAIPLEQRLHMS